MSYITGISGNVISAASAGFAPTNGADVSAIASAYSESAASGKLDSSASSSFYGVDNPSGFITGVDLSPYQLTADMSGYIPTGESANYQPVSAMTAYQLSGDYALSSDVSGVIDTVSSNSASWGGGGAQIVTATGSAAVGYGLGAQTAVSSINGSALLPYGFSAISGNSGNWNSTRTAVTANSANWNSVYNTVNSSSASWGGGGIDSATCSAIASSYAESAASSKMDSSAIDYTRTGNGTQIYASGTGSSTNQFSATNDSAGAAIIAGENARLRLWDTAATANLYASSIGGWNAAANLVSSQSANWGGSALALSAGPGVKLNMVGNTLVVGADETVLWSGTVSQEACSTFTLSEYASNFDRLRFYGSGYGNTPVMYECPAPTASTGPISVTYVYYCASTDGSPSQCRQSNYSSTNGLVFNASTHRFVYGNDARYSAGNTTQGAPIYKIVGINRTAEA